MEEQEGMKTRFDKKSLMRIVDRLASKGKIKSFKTFIKCGSEQKQV